MALVFALPIAVLSAALCSRLGLIESGFAAPLALCVIFELGYFVGCIAHSMPIVQAFGRLAPGSRD